MDYKIILTLTILVLALVAFVVEWLPADLTAILVAVVLMLVGLVSPDEGISGFSNSATITVMAMFIISAGITRTGVISIVRDWLIRLGGRNLSRQILVLGIIIGPISAFINNTAVVAIFLPIVEDWCKRQRISVSKLLIPLSYITVLAGMITVLGTSTNILASGLAKKLIGQEFNIFEFTPLGIFTFLIGLVYLAFAAPKILPARKPAGGDLLDQGYGLKDYLSEVIVAPRSNLVGKTLKEAALRRKFDVDVLEVIHNNVHLSQPLADKVLSAGDILVIRSSRDDLLKIKDERGLDLLADVKFQNEQVESVESAESVESVESVESLLTTGDEKVAEVLILSNSRLVGTTLKDIRFRQRYNVTVLAIRRGAELLQGRLGKIPLQFGDLLLVQGPKQSFLGLQTTRELLVLEEKDIDSLRRSKAWIAIAITVAVILIAALTEIPILVTSLCGVLLMVITGCLKPGEVYGAVRWDIIFLLAGLIPLGIAMDNSGTTEWLAKNITNIVEHIHPFWQLTTFYLITSLLTEILSNNAAVVLMLPLAVEVAKTLSLNPLAFMFVVTFAASNSYLTPIGYQTNTMVYAPGGYKFLDFTRVGLPLNILLTFLTPLFTWLVYGVKLG